MSKNQSKITEIINQKFEHLPLSYQNVIFNKNDIDFSKKKISNKLRDKNFIVCKFFKPISRF